MSDTRHKSGVDLLAKHYRDRAERELREEVARLNKALTKTREELEGERARVKMWKDLHDEKAEDLESDAGKWLEKWGEVQELEVHIALYRVACIVLVVGCVWGWLV